MGESSIFSKEPGARLLFVLFGDPGLTRGDPGLLLGCSDPLPGEEGGEDEPRVAATGNRLLILNLAPSGDD